MSTFTHSVQIRRPDATPLIIFTLVPAALFAAPSKAAFFSPNLAIAFVLLILAYQFGYMVNCVADRDDDADGHKSQFADAVAKLGLKNIVVQLALTVCVGVAIGIVLLVRTGHYDLIAIGIVGTALAVQYSFPPMLLKSRGVWQVPALIITMGIFPSLAILRSFEVGVDWTCLWAIVGTHIAFNGVAMVKTAEDYVEDGAHGVQTFVRAVGLRRSLLVGTAMILVGGVMILYTVFHQLGLALVELPLLLSIAAAALGTAALWARTAGMTAERAADVVRAVQPKFVIVHCTHLGLTILLASAAVLINRP